jgi:hypothetical protein
VEALGLTDGDSEADGLTDPEGDTDGDSEAEGDTDPDGDTDGESLAEGDTDAEGLTEGDSEADGDTLGLVTRSTVNVGEAVIGAAPSTATAGTVTVIVSWAVIW